jgi:SAM-dependent methyltransferase
LNLTGKAAWLADHLMCLSCAGALAPSDARWECLDCGAQYPVLNRAVSFIDEELAAQTKINAQNRVGEHAYTGSCNILLEEVRKQGGVALDCGAGSRAIYGDHLVQTEITPYDNIDVLAVNQKLPFKDASFDLVLSFNVLEHVSDPFLSARELVRVLKPGGLLYIDMPFIAVEHGYPHHYFNATRMGMRQLFEGLMTCEAHVVPNSGHPAHAAWALLHGFRGGIPKARRHEFEKMTVGEILAENSHALREKFDVGFSEAARWQCAGNTQAVFAKPWDKEGNCLSVDVLGLPVFKARPNPKP